MAYIALRIIFLIHFSCYYCLSQNMEQLLFASVREAVGEIKALSQKLTEIENTMSSKFEEMENKFEGLEGRMDIVQGQLTELQESSKVKYVLQTCVNLMEMERELQSVTLNKTCNNMNQIANLQESFSTELERIEHSISSKVSNLQELLATDECAAADSNDCSSRASCQDKMILYQCDCLPGYTGDGFTCGCATGFTDVPGAGCLKFIEEKKEFDEAITHCSTLSAQLVVPQNFQALLDYLASIPNHYYWIGVRYRKWLGRRDVAQEEGIPGQPDDISQCGYLKGDGIGDGWCRNTEYFICQLK